MFGQEGMFKKGTFKRHESHTEKAMKADAEIVKIDGIMPNKKMYDLWSRKNAELLLRCCNQHNAVPMTELYVVIPKTRKLLCCF